MVDLSNTYFNNTSYKSGKIKISIPDVDGSYNYSTIEGLLVGDIAFSMGVDWGPVLPDAEELNSLAQIIGAQNIVSWIQSSATVWKGSHPIEFKADFYLVSYYRTDDIKAMAKRLALMSTMYVDESSIITGKVHGGYRVDFARTNATVGALSYLEAPSADTLQFKQSKLSELTGSASDGTLVITIGDQMTFKNMLLDNITVTPSSVQVASGKPLYIRIEANFRGNRAPLSSDLNSIFGDATYSNGTKGNPSATKFDEKGNVTEVNGYHIPTLEDWKNVKGYNSSI